MAEALLKYETLDADQFRDLMEGNPLNIEVPKKAETKVKDKEKKEKVDLAFY